MSSSLSYLLYFHKQIKRMALLALHLEEPLCLIFQSLIHMGGSSPQAQICCHLCGKQK